MVGIASKIVDLRRLKGIDADLIYVMDEGRLIESGCHKDLVDAGGVYARLYRVDSVGESILPAPNQVAN